MSSSLINSKINSEGKGPAAASDPKAGRKLPITAKDGFAEKEARSVADRVMLNQTVPLIRNQLHRQPLSISLSSEGENKITAGSSEDLSDTPQAGLDRETMSFMETRFNQNFSAVNIHTDNMAAQNAEKLNAKAFTVGNDIYFNSGYYNPGSAGGKKLLAHELAHTVQQKGLPMQIQREEKNKDETYVPKPEIDFEFLPPEFKLRIFHFMLKADTGKLSLDYQTQNFMAGLSYQYGDALSFNTKFRDFKTKLGWTPGDNKFGLGLNYGGFGTQFSASPWKGQYGLGLTYGLQLRMIDKMNTTFTAGGSSVAGMAMGMGGEFDDPIAYYQAHKDDIENISKTADMIKQITKAGESKIKFGGGISITYDPTSQLVIGGRFGILF